MTLPTAIVDPAGFIAGTLVHTKAGLRPIEEFKVGDWVLCRPQSSEQGTESAYRRVTDISRYENQRLLHLSFKRRPADDLSGEKYGDSNSTFDGFFGTRNQPVWVDGHGWLATDLLFEPSGSRRRRLMLDPADWYQPLLRSADGSACHITNVSDCFRTDFPLVVFTEDSWEYLGGGTTWDFNELPVKMIDQVGFDSENWSNPETDEPVHFTATAFTIEVEEFHTYYVGKLGLLVHDGCVNRLGETSET